MSHAAMIPRDAEVSASQIMDTNPEIYLAVTREFGRFSEQWGELDMAGIINLISTHAPHTHAHTLTRSLIHADCTHTHILTRTPTYTQTYTHHYHHIHLLDHTR